MERATETLALVKGEFMVSCVNLFRHLQIKYTMEWYY